jgi:hypothetical protein
MGANIISLPQTQRDLIRMFLQARARTRSSSGLAARANWRTVLRDSPSLAAARNADR